MYVVFFSSFVNSSLLFSSSCIEDKLKSKETGSLKKTKLKELLERLKACAQKNKQSLDLKSKRMKEREKKVVCKSFHRCGIVVPVDENDVGYREVPETPGKEFCNPFKVLLLQNMQRCMLSDTHEKWHSHQIYETRLVLF